MLHPLTQTDFMVTHQLTSCTVQLLGNQPRTPTATAVSTGFRAANALGAQPNRTYRVIAPSNESGTGFGLIVSPDNESIVRAEGVFLQEPASCAFIEHADCPVVVWHDPKRGETLVHHAGRPALAPIDGKNIITTAFERITKCSDVATLEVYIAGSICGAHFPNEAGAGHQHATRILEVFGPEVFADLKTLAFSPAAVVRLQLLAAGLEAAQIQHDDVCTYAHPGLASHRQHSMEGRTRTTSNLTVVLNH